MSNFLDNVGKFINESCCGYYSTSTSGNGGVSSAVMRQLKGMYAVDTPIDGSGSYISGSGNTIRAQVAKQAEYTLQQRNYLLSQIDRVSGHWIAHAIKSIIASDGFNDLCSKYDIFIRYTDEENLEKSEQFSDDIGKLLKRTAFLDILKDCIMNEGLDYCELFLTTPVKNGYGVEYVSDNLNTKEHIGIYKNTNLIGAVRFEITPKGMIRGKEFIKADQLSHFLLGYKKIPLAISKDFNKKYRIPEKIRCAYPILTPVIDMIIQYDQLQKLQSALEMIKATQPIVMGVGVSAENNMTEIVRQLQEWGLTLNENKNNIVNNLDTCDTASIMQSMYNILMIPYSVEEGVNSLKQVAVDFPNSNLPEVLDSLGRSIALALGIPEQYIALIQGGAKENKDDHIATNPRYSKMLSMIQQSISRGIVEFIFKHLVSRYTNPDGVLTEFIDKDKIEVLFKSSTNINNKLEDERLMLKAENMQSMVGVIDTVASSPNIPAKVKGEQFLEYWRTQMEKDPHIREMFEIMSDEEIKQMQGIPNPEDDGNAMPPPDEAPQEIQTIPVKGDQQQKQAEAPQQQQVQQQVPQQNVSKQEEVIRNSFQ